MFGLSSDQAADSSKRLVFGYDGGCCACSGMAERIKERIGDKLEVMSLRDPQAQEWRKKALGEDAPWAPTLFEVNGSEVRAWTGWRMGAQLSRFLGPVATWRVMQILGEVSATSEVVEESSAAKVASGLTRGQFLKGVGGAALAMTILSGAGKLARPVYAAKITDTRELTGSKLVDVARRYAKRADMINLGGQTWSNGMRNGNVTNMCKTIDGKFVCWKVICHDPAAGCSPSWGSNGLVMDAGSTAIKAFRHTYSDGNTMTAVAYLRSNDRVMYMYNYANPVRDGGGSLKTQAAKYRIESGQAVMKSFSVNGKEVTLHDPQAGTVSAASSCGSCGLLDYYWDVSVCYEPIWQCAVGACSLCLAGSCSKFGAPGCLGCVLIGCPASITYYACCNSSGTECAYCY